MEGSTMDDPKALSMACEETRILRELLAREERNAASLRTHLSDVLRRLRRAESKAKVNLATKTDTEQRLAYALSEVDSLRAQLAEYESSAPDNRNFFARWQAGWVARNRHQAWVVSRLTYYAKAHQATILQAKRQARSAEQWAAKYRDLTNELDRLYVYIGRMQALGIFVRE